MHASEHCAKEALEILVSAGVDLNEVDQVCDTLLLAHRIVIAHLLLDYT